MQQHFLSRIYDHYFEEDTERIDENEFVSACTIFFGEPTLNVEAEGLFNEWLLFEHRMRPPEGGKPMTLLERWIEENPKQVGSMTMQKYKDLAEQNRYDWYEVIAVRLDSGLTLRSVRDGAVYEVQEKSGTHQVRPGNVFIARVGPVDGVYELVGADSIALPSEPGGKEVEECGAHLKGTSWGVADTYHLMYKDSNDDDTLSEVETYAYEERRAIADGNALLKEIDLDAIINFSLLAERVREVCDFVEAGVDEEVCMDAFAHPARLLLGLAAGSTHETRILDELFDHYTNLMSHVIFGRLSAMTPYAHKKYKPWYDACSTANIEAEKLFAWMGYYQNCMEYLEKDEYEQALVEANAICEALFTQGVVPRQVLLVLMTIAPVYARAGYYDSAVRILRAASTLRGTEDMVAKHMPDFDSAPSKGAHKTPADTYVAWVLTQGLDFRGDMLHEGEVTTYTPRTRAPKKRALSNGRKTSPRQGVWREGNRAGVRKASPKK